MTLVPPRSRQELPDLEPFFALLEESMGFVPESTLTMAHWPELLGAFGGLGATVLNSGEVDSGLKQLVAFASSNAAGCRYCQAHTSHSAHRRGVPAEKIKAVFDYEQSGLFSDAERAALRVAAHAGMVPNAVEPAHLVALREHFSDRQVVEIVAVIALFGFLNRWNDTLATTLEDGPRQFASATLDAWDAGKHS